MSNDAPSPWEYMPRPTGAHPPRSEPVAGYVGGVVRLAPLPTLGLVVLWGMRELLLSLPIPPLEFGELVFDTVTLQLSAVVIAGFLVLTWALACAVLLGAAAHIRRRLPIVRAASLALRATPRLAFLLGGVASLLGFVVWMAPKFNVLWLAWLVTAAAGGAMAAYWHLAIPLAVLGGPDQAGPVVSSVHLARGRRLVGLAGGAASWLVLYGFAVVLSLLPGGTAVTTAALWIGWLFFVSVAGFGLAASLVSHRPDPAAVEGKAIADQQHAMERLRAATNP